MENAIAIAAIAGPVYLVFGLSILLYAKTWQKVINGWQKDHLTLLPLMFINLTVGMIIIRMYNSWEWNVWLLVTITGWGMFLKGAFYMLAPSCWIKSWMSMASCCKIMLRISSLAVIAMGAALSYYTYFV